MNISEIEKHVRGLLVAIGEDPDREGLRETPARVARMYEEAFEGIKYTNREIADMFGKTFEIPSDPNSGGAVVIKDISVFSYCEHHLALMYDMKVDVAYVARESFGIEQNRSHLRYGGKAVAIAGAFGAGYCRDNFACGYISRRRRKDRGLSQLYDIARDKKRIVKNGYQNLFRGVQRRCFVTKSFRG